MKTCKVNCVVIGYDNLKGLLFDDWPWQFQYMLDNFAKIAAKRSAHLSLCRLEDSVKLSENTN